MSEEAKAREWGERLGQLLSEPPGAFLSALIATRIKRNEMAIMDCVMSSLLSDQSAFVAELAVLSGERRALLALRGDLDDLLSALRSGTLPSKEIMRWQR